VPALPPSVLEPLWDQFAALLPHRDDPHPLGCHRARIPDRVVFDKLIQVLVCSRFQPVPIRQPSGIAVVIPSLYGVGTSISNIAAELMQRLGNT
jgi:hypothetical protein